MVFIMELFRGDPWREDLQTFSCHSAIWRRLLEIGRQNGWKPAGADPGTAMAPYERNQFKSLEYSPVNIAPSNILAEDAANWADALERALDKWKRGEFKIETGSPSPILIGDDMTEEQYIAANSGVSEGLLKEFIAYIRGGQFKFCWDS